MSLMKDEQSSGLEMKEGVENSAFQGDSQPEESSRRGQEQAVSMEGCPAGEESYTQIRPHAGMPKEVLLLYSGQARYRLPREILFWLTVACTLALVALTITVIVLSPPCLSWWQTTPVYQVYPRSFKDSDADGVGDLKGIKEKLSHFQYLNIKAVWISPFYKSPMKDFGYDVEDFRAVDPLFGTMEDFDDLLASMHSMGIKLIMDYIPNHTSDKHVWFQLSRNRTDHYSDFYIWVNCTEGHPPNNWVSVFGNSTWTYDPERGQCYFHQFLKEQPDLNFRNPDVVKEMTDVIHFWLKKGVDGFRMDAVKHMLEATHLRNEPQVDPNQPPETVNTEFELYHDYTYTQVGLHDILRGWRVVLDEYSREPGRYRFMVTECYDYEEIEKTMMYYGTPFVKEADIPFNFYLLDLPDGLSGVRAKELVELWMSNMPTGKWPNWVVGNHDKPRMSSRTGQEYVRAINMLLLTLPGTPTTYYGEEIGMENVNVSVTQDPFGKFDPNNSRDPQRTPMQWNGQLNAGFSDSQNGTWLDIGPNYQTVNVEVQQGDPLSVLELYRALNLLREKDVVLLRGWLCYIWEDANVFAFLRELDGLNRAFLVVLNFGEDSETDLSAITELPDQLSVRISTLPDTPSSFQKARIRTSKGQGLLLEYSTSQRFHTGHSSQCYVSEKACYLSALDILYKC
ncbi:neutral and basic amino acid transport protein rBAT isoform X1 [Colossoma macropomum]|uniref:neutral and basic amino acid transport protein rBAT isoform X1 n=1 Tax=Colossoma macropomum TaxID=42526 RepID=UPI001865237F|nr:neutral and basic amino acid transport protein rBAT isoform X1 [Colossoma macropomum]